MAHDASQNNPAKETIHALIGIVLLLVIISGIAVFGWLRPAGNHEPATVSATPAGRTLDELIQKEANDNAQATATAEASAETAEAPEGAEAPVEDTATAEAQADAPAEQAQEQPAESAVAEASSETPAEQPAQ